MASLSKKGQNPCAYSNVMSNLKTEEPKMAWRIPNLPQRRKVNKPLFKQKNKGGEGPIHDSFIGLSRYLKSQIPRGKAQSQLQKLILLLADFHLLLTTDAELARFSWRKAPSASSKYKYSYASADLYQSTLSGSKLSLLNFAIILLEKPSSLGRVRKKNLSSTTLAWVFTSNFIGVLTLSTFWSGQFEW